MKQLAVLKLRFEENPHRHPDIKWIDVENRLNENPDKLQILENIESTGGQPDVVGIVDDEFVFFDCAKECNTNRKSICYDEDAWNSRKSNKPQSSVEKEVKKLGSILLNEEDYFYLQSIEDVDLKSSCWLDTPPEIREKKGAIFGDKRFGRAFIYHNGVESYYASRGFRTKVYV